MAAPAQAPPTPTLYASARALLEPRVVELPREPFDDTDARATTERLRRQYATLAARGLRPQARRVLSRLIAHETARQALVEAAAVRQGDVPALLDQVCEAVESSRGSGRRTSTGPHRAAIGLSAAELIGDIERQVGRGPRALLGRRVWSWVRVHAGDDAAAVTAAGWVDRARDIVDPPRPVHLAGACPECHRRIVHVQDAGEWVRRPALQVDRDSMVARCVNPRCGAEWSEARFPLLARVLEQQATEDRARKITAERVIFVRGVGST